MSRRKRHTPKQQLDAPIEWLTHRTGYPSPEERQRIIEMRTQLTASVMLVGLRRISKDSRPYLELVERYGEEEIRRAEAKLRDTLELPSRVANDAKSYREYRTRYSKFGAGLTFYSAQEMEELQLESAKQYKAFLEDKDRGETIDSDIDQQLLFGWREWEDITPPTIPPRPEGFNSPTPASYPAPINELLEWGDDLKKSHDFSDEAEHLRWKKFVPALTRMALDPGLLHGWPTEKASWASWHAIHALGNLQAWESIPALAGLADIENDWLSDHLPHIFVDMGNEAEPMLWMVLENHSASAKQRGLVADALLRLSEDNPAFYNKVIKGFGKILQTVEPFNPQLNAYLAMFLNDMEIEDSTIDIIEQVISAGRLDESIFSIDDLQPYEDDDDE